MGKTDLLTSRNLGKQLKLFDKRTVEANND